MIDPKDALILELRAGLKKAVKEIKTGYALIDELEERDEDDIESGDHLLEDLNDLVIQTESTLAGPLEELIAGAEAQHEAIDILFAMLIVKDNTFRPSKSGQPWDAVIQAGHALKQIEEAFK